MDDVHSIEISGPDDTYLLMEPTQGRYQWRLRNDGLSALKKLRLEIMSARSFNASKSAFRDPIEIRVQWPLVEELRAGNFSSGALFVRFDGDKFGFGTTANKHLLHWPGADQSTSQRWLLSLRVTGLSKEWLIELDLWWTVGTKTLALTRPPEPGG